MEINSEQYRKARTGWFFAECNARKGEEVVLNMPTGSGRRMISVGVVTDVKWLSAGRCMVLALGLQHVEGIY